MGTIPDTTGRVVSWKPKFVEIYNLISLASLVEFFAFWKCACGFLSGRFWLIFPLLGQLEHVFAGTDFIYWGEVKNGGEETVYCCG